MSTDTPDYAPAMSFINTLLARTGIDAQAVSARSMDGNVVFLVEGDIGTLNKRPELTSAFTLLTGQAMNRMDMEKISISLDLGGQFDARQRLLEVAADDAARAVQKNNRRAVFERLSSSERRVVHQRLADRDDVHTFSEGREGMRLLMVETSEGAQD